MPDQTLKAALLMGCLVSASGAAAFERDQVYGPLPHHETYNPLIAYRHPQDRTTVGTRPTTSSCPLSQALADVLQARFLIVIKSQLTLCL